jgi:uncharacterized protein
MTTLRKPTTLREAVDDFLAQRRIAVAGVSRESQQAANFIYRRFRDAGYEVYAVNPRADEVEGDPCYPDLASLPVSVGGVVAVTPVAATEALARECAALGIPRLWMHHGVGTSSVSQSAVDVCRKWAITAIPGACPMMYLEPVDVGHRCFRCMKWLTGKLPAPV